MKVRTLFGDELEYIFSCYDQREAQSRGGVCVRHPYSCFFCDVLRFLGCDGCTVVDLTYGVGGFYVACRDVVGRLIGIDVRRWDWLVEPDEFHQGPFWVVAKDLPRGVADFVVFDPPYATSPTGKHPGTEYLYHGREYLPIMIEKLPEVAKHLLKPGGYVVAKIMDAHRDGYVDWRLSHFGLAETMIRNGFRLRDVLIFRSVVYRRSRSGRHIFKVHSYLLIFQM